jgi:membrane protein
LHSVLRRTLRLIVDAYDRYDQHGDLLAGSLAFFALLSLAPLIVIAISVASLLVDREQVRSGLLSGLGDFASAEIVQQLVQLVDAIKLQQSGVGAVIAGVVLLFAASRLFIQVEEALNLIWGVTSKPAANTRERVQRLIIKRLISFAMVLACGVLLLSMLVVQAALALIGAAASRALGMELAVFAPPVVFLVLLTLLLALIYRVLPDAEIHFTDVWVGAATTALLILAGTWLLGLYLTKIAPGWLQGAAGALAAFMVWIYYLAQVFLLGAAFTRTWAVRERRRAAKPEEP